jgi:hypothetical protein
MELMSQQSLEAETISPLELAESKFILPDDLATSELLSTNPATRIFNKGYRDKNLDRYERDSTASQKSAGFVEYLTMLLRSGVKSSVAVRSALNEEISDKDCMLRESQSSFYKEAKSAREVCYSLVTSYGMKHGDVQIMLVDKHYGKKTSNSNQAFRDALEEKWDELDLDASTAPSHIGFHGKLPRVTCQNWRIFFMVSRPRGFMLCPQ